MFELKEVHGSSNDFGPNYYDIGQNCTVFGPNYYIEIHVILILGQKRYNLGQNRNNLGQNRNNLGQNRNNLGQKR